MVGELKRHFRDKGWTIRVPRRLQELGLRINGLLPTISQDLGRSPTIAELATRREVEEEEVVEAMEAAQAYATTSLDFFFNDTATTEIYTSDS
jgi:RNA polymerase sigma-B factor